MPNPDVQWQLLHVWSLKISVLNFCDISTTLKDILEKWYKIYGLALS